MRAFSTVPMSGTREKSDDDLLATLAGALGCVVMAPGHGPPPALTTRQYPRQPSLSTRPVFPLRGLAQPRFTCPVDAARRAYAEGMWLTLRRLLDQSACD
jgi:hypothetical protein